MRRRLRWGGRGVRRRFGGPVDLNAAPGSSKKKTGFRAVLPLWDSEERFSRLIETLPVGVVVDLAGRLTFANAVKHSRAGLIRVAIPREGESLRVQVEDDGVGLVPSEAVSPMAKGFGLFSAQELFGRTGWIARPGRCPGLRLQGNPPRTPRYERL